MSRDSVSCGNNFKTKTSETETIYIFLFPFQLSLFYKKKSLFLSNIIEFRNLNDCICEKHLMKSVTEKVN